MNYFSVLVKIKVFIFELSLRHSLQGKNLPRSEEGMTIFFDRKMYVDILDNLLFYEGNFILVGYQFPSIYAGFAGNGFSC